MMQSTFAMAPLMAAAGSAGGFFSGGPPEALFTPEHAPLVALAFLGTGGGLLAAAGAAALALALKKRGLAARIGAAAGMGAALYALLLLAASLASRERVLPRGARKYFCEVDCHLAYSLESVDRKRTVGSAPLIAKGVFTVARVRTWFDPSTIASFRGHGPLYPNPRQMYVVDADGLRYDTSAAGTKALEEEEAFGRSTPFSAPLTPGQSYETSLVFDLPPGIRSPRLFVGDPEGIERVLIGHENSFLHRKLFFDLAERPPDRAGKK